MGASSACCAALVLHGSEDLRKSGADPKRVAIGPVLKAGRCGSWPWSHFTRSRPSHRTWRPHAQPW